MNQSAELVASRLMRGASEKMIGGVFVFLPVLR
jgi:hypothetical protein